MDPNATATWGLTDPQLIVFRIKTGSKILSGEAQNVSAVEAQRIQALADQYHCQTQEDKRDRPFDTFSEVVGVFHNQADEVCRKIIIQAAIELGIQDITYPFTPCL